MPGAKQSDVSDTAEIDSQFDIGTFNEHAALAF